MDLNKFGNLKNFLNDLNEMVTDQQTQYFKPVQPTQATQQRQAARPAAPMKAKAKTASMTAAEPEPSVEGRPSEVSPIYTDEIGMEEHVLTIDHNSVLNGIIFSEILGKPKSRRAGW